MDRRGEELRALDGALVDMVRREVREAVAALVPTRMTVGAITAGLVRPTDPVVTTFTWTQGLAYLAGRPAVGDEVLVLEIPGSGDLDEAAAPAPIALGTVRRGTLPKLLPGETWADGESNTSAENPDNASQSAFATAQTFRVEDLPVGTYRGWVGASLLARHTTDGNAGTLRVQVVGATTVDDEGVTLGLASVTPSTTRLDASCGVGPIAPDGDGTLTVRLQFRPATAGTMEVRNPSVSVLVRRLT